MQSVTYTLKLLVSCVPAIQCKLQKNAITSRINNLRLSYFCFCTNVGLGRIGVCENATGLNGHNMRVQFIRYH